MTPLEVIRRRRPGFQPQVAVVLGSGLGGLSDQMVDAMAIPYGDLKGFPRPGVSGHQGQLVLAKVGQTPVALLEGRAHLYETGRADAMKVAVHWQLGAAANWKRRPEWPGRWERRLMSCRRM